MCMSSRYFTIAPLAFALNEVALFASALSSISLMNKIVNNTLHVFPYNIK